MSYATKKKFNQFLKRNENLEKQKVATIFQTHSVSKSEAEIIFPPERHKQAKFDSIHIITCGQKTIYAQVSEGSKSEEKDGKISILTTLVKYSGIQCDGTGAFKGEIRQTDSIPDDYRLEFVEIVIKHNYFSRRDQYKVTENISKREIHAYTKKSLSFDDVKLEVTNMMFTNNKLTKIGVIDKNTKLIFRSACSKYTVLLQISREMFELNEYKELYLDKAIQFLSVFYKRNNFFQTKHRLEIILYARLFYPQFRTLEDAYKVLEKQATIASQTCKIEINFAVALQKDFRGRIYQDAYRNILLQAGNMNKLREIIWEKVSEFMYTVNWYSQQSYAKFLYKSVEDKVKEDFQVENINIKKAKAKPFRHRLKSQLAESLHCNFFEAISLISEQYKRHYSFRSLRQTGNAITIISAGSSVYQVDDTTYKMAKDNVYLTNISCIQVNVKRKISNLSASIAYLAQKPRYKQQNKHKLENLIDFCIEQAIYLSPSNLQIEFQSDFQLKSLIYPENLVQIYDEHNQPFQKKKIHDCKKTHYFNDERKQKVAFDFKKKPIEWISTFYMSNLAFRIHEKFYGKNIFQIDFFCEKVKYNPKEDEFETFQKDLLRISNKRQTKNLNEYDFQSSFKENVIQYVNWAQRPRESSERKKQFKQELDALEEKLFAKQSKKQNKKKQFDSNSETTSRLDKSFEDRFSNSDEKSFKSRKISEKLELSDEKNKKTEKNENNTEKKNKINIFEKTFREGQYEVEEKNSQLSKKKKMVSHNKQRLRNNYKQSYIHYMMSSYSEQALKQLESFINKKSGNTTDKWMILKEQFELEKSWKNIIFPILTPIYTNYKAHETNKWKKNPKYTKVGPTIYEDEICQLLMQNYQIQNKKFNDEQVYLSKGHVNCLLKTINKGTVSLIENIDPEIQKTIIPHMLYRYLCYEEKDSRFCTKSINFSDENFYVGGKNQEKKSVKLLILHDDAKFQNLKEENKVEGKYGKNQQENEQERKKEEKRFQKLKNFINVISDKFNSVKFDLVLGKSKVKSETIQFEINLQSNKNKIYKNEKIKLKIDKAYKSSNIFQILVEWDYCCATLVNQFLNYLVSTGRKKDLKMFLVSKDDVFNTRWSISTIGQIIFTNQNALLMLKSNVQNLKKQDHWFWDNQDYKKDQDFYMDKNGEAFIRFKEDKNMILWKDNTVNETGHENNFYNYFFMKSAAYDILDGLIDNIFERMRNI